MINKPPPFKGLNIRILIIILIKRRGFKLLRGLHYIQIEFSQGGTLKRRRLHALPHFKPRQLTLYHMIQQHQPL